MPIKVNSEGIRIKIGSSNPFFPSAWKVGQKVVKWDEVKWYTIGGRFIFSHSGANILAIMNKKNKVFSRPIYNERGFRNAVGKEGF